MRKKYPFGGRIDLPHGTLVLYVAPVFAPANEKFGIEGNRYVLAQEHYVVAETDLEKFLASDIVYHGMVISR